MRSYNSLLYYIHIYIYIHNIQHRLFKSPPFPLYNNFSHYNFILFSKLLKRFHKPIVNRYTLTVKSAQESAITRASRKNRDKNRRFPWWLGRRILIRRFVQQFWWHKQDVRWLRVSVGARRYRGGHASRHCWRLDASLSSMDLHSRLSRRAHE